MTVTDAVDIGSLISRRPDFKGGRPVIAGTGVTVQRIAMWYKLGYSPEETARQIRHVTVAQVYAALAYYHANREEVERGFAEDEAAGERLEAERRALTSCVRFACTSMRTR